MLQKHQQKQEQAGQIKEFHLNIQLNNSITNAAADTHATLDQTEEAGFGFLQKESSNPKVA